MPNKKADIIYVVVWVHSGVPYEVEAYRDAKTAKARERFYKKDINPDYDEVNTFEVEVGKRAAKN